MESCAGDRDVTPPAMTPTTGSSTRPTSLIFRANPQSTAIIGSDIGILGMASDLIILGINAYHADAAACIVRDGTLVAAAEEERFRRIKHWAGFPSQAIRYCLNEAKVDLDDVTHVAINRSGRANFLRKLTYVMSRPPSPRLLANRLCNRKQMTGIAEELGALPGRPFAGKIDYVEHHLAHLASAFYPSPFREATVVSVDGFGDFASAAWGRGIETSLSLDGRVLFPHSLGIFYQAMTQYLGFQHYGDEYKVMGLAAYGDPSCRDEVNKLVSLCDDGSFMLDLKYFRHHRDDIGYEWPGGKPVCGPLFSQALLEALGPSRSPNSPIEKRHCNLAWATQAVYEDAFFHLLNTLQRHYGHTAAALAGGCAYNSVANGKIRDRTAFTRCYLQSAAGDAGGAIGAAYAVWHRYGSRTPEMSHAFWGPSFTEPEFSSLLIDQHAAIEAEGCSVRHIVDEKELVEMTAGAIADGLVVGWFQGRMEWGPRALGNRSILGDPRRADMKNMLNLKIKRREVVPPIRALGLARGRWRLVRARRRCSVHAAGFSHPAGAPRADTGSNPRRWNWAAPDRRSRRQSSILCADRGVLSAHRRANGAKHVIQRKRARRLPTGRGVGLLSPNQNGCSGARQFVRAARGSH